MIVTKMLQVVPVHVPNDLRVFAVPTSCELRNASVDTANAGHENKGRRQYLVPPLRRDTQTQ
jgi:hypothetical protein